MGRDGARRPVGRPRRLTREAIVAAACDIGLAHVEMSHVAERLNTGVATLYSYVRGRDHLLELAARKLATEALADRGQGWQDVLRDHAAISYDLFKALPQLIVKMMGDTDIDAHSRDYFDMAIDMLESRGMPRAIAIDAYIEVSQALVGAAICLKRREALERGGQPSADIPAILGDYRPTLERIIAEYARVEREGKDGWQ